MQVRITQTNHFQKITDTDALQILTYGWSLYFHDIKNKNNVIYDISENMKQKDMRHLKERKISKTGF